MDATAYAYERIRSTGNRLTDARKVIITHLARAQNPLSIKEIAQSVATDEVSVYRSIALFRKIGLIEEIVLPDGTHSFSLSSGHHHHHIVCRSCSLVVHVPCVEGAHIVEPTHRAFAHIDGHDVMYYGTCASCV